MIKVLIYMAFFLVDLHGLFGQTNKFSPTFTEKKNKITKNKVEIFYAPSYTKTNFSPSIKERSNISLFLREWLASQTPNKALWGKSIGIGYQRRLNEKVELAFFIRHTEKGQKSPHFFNYYLKSDSTDYPSGYGGMMYEVKLKTSEFGALIKRRVKENDLFSVSIDIGMSLDMYNDLIINDFIIEKDTGIKRPGCCTSFFYRSNEDYLDRLWGNIKEKHFRIGLLFASTFDFSLTEVINISVHPELEYLTKLVHNSRYVKSHSVLDGSIFLMNIQCSIGIKF